MTHRVAQTTSRITPMNAYDLTAKQRHLQPEGCGPRLRARFGGKCSDRDNTTIG